VLLQRATHGLRYTEKAHRKALAFSERECSPAITLSKVTKYLVLCVFSCAGELDVLLQRAARGL
jgi:hypothetical protein